MSLEFIQAQQRLLARVGVDARPQYIDVPAVEGRAHVLTVGEGPPVVMVIGSGVPAAMWAPLMARLDGFTLHAVDIPGIGLTDPVTSSTAGMRPWAARFLEDVIDGLGLDRPVVVGHSMGGLWTSWLALDRPERVGALTLVGCPALILGSSAPLPMRLMAKPAIARLMQRLQPPSAKQVDRFASMANEDFSHLPELREMLLAGQRLPTYGESLVGFLSAAIRLRGARPEVTLTADQLRRIRQPVQLIWGEDDPFGSPALARRAAEAIPDARLHIVPGGHAPWFRYAGHVADVAGPFLRRHVEPPTARPLASPAATGRYGSAGLEASR